MNLEIPKSNQERFGTKSLRYLDLKVWNSLELYTIQNLQETSNKKLEV